MKTIVKERYLQIRETIDDAHNEHGARHRAKLAGTPEILQAEVSSLPDATKKFSEDQVERCYTSHKKETAANHEAVAADKEETNHKPSSKASAKVSPKAKTSDIQQSDIGARGV